MALAESISAGFASYLITKTPGASKVFKGGIIVYSLEAKAKFFKIPQTTLKKYDGVSEDIALILAKRIKKLFRSDIGAAIVGFAGPRTKKGVKVGTVFIGLSFKNILISQKKVIKGSRDAIRKKASQLLINLIDKQLT